jgi:glucosylceramidase
LGPVYSQLVQKNTQVPCVTDTQGKTAPGTPVELSTCLMSSDQNWTIESDGTIRIKDRCMDTSSPGGGAGSLIVLNPCNGASSQIWTTGPTSSLLDQASGLCLSDPGSNAANGTQLNIETCTGGKYQQWHLPAV